jgi:hypothetical protein
MKARSTGRLASLVVSTALGLVACSDDGAPIDDGTETDGSATTSMTSSGVTLTTTVSGTSDPDTTGDGTTGDGTTGDGSSQDESSGTGTTGDETTGDDSSGGTTGHDTTGGLGCTHDDDCGGGTCIENACAPNVVLTAPDDDVSDTPVDTTIEVTFSGAMNPSTLTAQIEAGSCSGSVQVSYDGFTSCIGFSAAAPVMSGDDTVATWTPDPALAHGVDYELRVTDEAEGANGLALANEHESGFSTLPPGDCAGTIVISQIYGGGGNAGAQWTHDFVVLHNTGRVPATLDGWSLQYAAAASENWGGSHRTLLHGVIAPGGHHLVQLAGGANGDDPPTPDVTGTTNLAAGSGKVALVRDTEALTGDCPNDATIVDFVGYGTASCYEGSGAGPTLSNTTATHRDVSGCFDADDNASDFTVGTPVPLNAASTPAHCSCALDVVQNETDDPDEADWCILESPASFSVDALTTTQEVLGHLYEEGLTGGATAPEGVVAQVGYGRPITDIDDLEVGWAWFTAAWNEHFDGAPNDEFMASFPAPAVTTGTDYEYTYRFSLDDGLTWTYCDLEGAGSDPGLAFDPDALGVMTVNP